MPYSSRQGKKNLCPPLYKLGYACAAGVTMVLVHFYLK